MLMVEQERAGLWVFVKVIIQTADLLLKAASKQCIGYLERHLLHGPRGRMSVSKTRSVISMASPTFSECRKKASVLKCWRKACIAIIYVKTQVPKVGSVPKAKLVPKVGRGAAYHSRPCCPTWQLLGPNK